MNIHNPVRYADESQEAYAARRKQSAVVERKRRQIGVGGTSSRVALRNAQRDSGAMKKVAGAYGRGLMNWIASNQAARLANRKNAKMARACA